MTPILLFEDSLAAQFTPVALLRPVFELRCGHFTVRERWEAVLGTRVHGVFVRSELAEVYREEHPETLVNSFNALRSKPVILVNGRWIGNSRELLQRLPENGAAFASGELVAIWLTAIDPLPESSAEFPLALQELAKQRTAIEVPGVMVRYPWDLVHHNLAQLTSDFQGRCDRSSLPELNDRVAILGGTADVQIHSTADIDPFVVIDARRGPVWIENGVKVQAFSRIEGPAYIGEGTQLFRANIRAGCSLGPVCRIGGEIEQSIFQGFDNKYHDGFVGHSYLGSWVNLGALTSNSDLKNDYSPVKVPLAGRAIETGDTKVGCFIGDHTKTALCSLFNTGSSIGVMTLILPGGELLPKHVPSFCRVWHGCVEELPQGIDSSLEVARTAMNRRQRTLTPAAEILLRDVYQRTTSERHLALQRQQGVFG